MKLGERAKNLTGQKFGRLTALALSHRGADRNAQWLCICECGNAKTICRHHLLRGSTVSCGCLRRTQKVTHGLRKSPEYKIWQAMKYRCSEKTAVFKNYAGRGISVCAEWADDFATFYADMGQRPSAKHTIERKDNNAGYSKSNCEWATRQVQANNKRGNRRISHCGRLLTAAEWSRELGVSQRNIANRLKRGKDTASVLSVIVREPVRIEHAGVSKTVSEWSRDLGIGVRAITKRLQRGESVSSALSPEPRKIGRPKRSP